MTNITLPRVTVEQALEALLKSHTCPLLPDDCEEAITALRAALAQQAEPVQGPEGMVEFLADLQRSRTKYPKNRRMFDGLMGEIDELRRAYAGDGDIRAEAFDVAVCAFRIATEGDAGGNARLEQAEPDHETRAELAEQQVVQLAEERDHYRNLWQKAQQAEPLPPLWPPTGLEPRGCPMPGACSCPSKSARSTHSDECWQWHQACAVAAVIRLRAEVARLSKRDGE